MNLRELSYTIGWNLFLITTGSIIFSLGVKAIAVHHQFVTGGVFGTALLLNYVTDYLSPGILYFLFNIPLFIIGWVFVSCRFFFYSLYAMIVATLAFELIHLNFQIHDQLYAAVAAGVFTGVGVGIVLRSLGSNGGLDMVGIILLQKFNIGIGKFYLIYNGVLFAFTLLFLEIDLVIASMIMVFISSVSIEYMVSLFNQRKMVFIVSDKSEEIGRCIQEDLKQGATFIMGRGLYSRKDKNIVLTVINNIQLKRLEELVFTLDQHAFFIVENTFNVLGSTFAKRKIY